MTKVGRGTGWLLLTLTSLACSEPTPSTPEVPDPSEGRSLFRQACNECHVMSDGLDLALFGFPRADIERRAVSHVTSAEAAAIATYIESIGVPAVGTDHRLFQPADGQLAESDEAFWISVFGEEGIPDGFTADDLRQVDPRALRAPFLLPPWSDEEGESDWLPEHPLPDGLLGAENGRLQRALDTYTTSLTERSLLDLLAEFEVVSNRAGQVCQGTTLSLDRPLDCFEARRWMASLAALHLLREGSDEPPAEVLRLWWSVGEAGVNVRFHKPRFEGLDQKAFEDHTLSWLYLAYQFQPDISESRGGYIGIFAAPDTPWFATFAQLRRMVQEGELEEELPWKPVEDALLALLRVPAERADEVSLWAFSYVRDRLDDDLVLTGDDRDKARSTWETVPAWYKVVTGLDWAEAPEELRAVWTAVRDRLGPET